MAFDINTAKPVKKGFDINTAKPVTESPRPSDTPKKSTPFRDLTTGGGFMMGYSDPAAGYAQLASRVSPDARTPEMVLQGMPSTRDMMSKAVMSREPAYQSPEGIDWKRIGGNVVNPASAATMAIPVSQATLPARMLSGAGAAGAYGAGMPVTAEDYPKAKRAQVRDALLAGGVIPGVTALGGKGLQIADQATRPFGWRKAADKFMGTKVSPIQRDVVDRLSNTLGKGKQKVVDALENYRLYPHLDKMTSTQALGQANMADDATRFGGSVAKLESELSSIPESGLSDDIQTVYKTQRAARRNTLEKQALTDAQMKAYEDARSAVVKPYYDIVDKSKAKVDSSRVLTEIDDLIARNPNKDTVVKPLQKIRKKLINGDDLESSPVALKSLSQDISHKIQAKTPSGQTKHDVATLSQVKGILDEQITDAVEEYGIGQRLFMEHSRPINQAQIVREMIKKIDSADVKEESVKPFLRAAKDEAKIIKAATGFKRGKSLEDIFKGNEKGFKELTDVIEDLDVNVESAKMASEVGSVFSGIKTGIEARAPSILKTEVVLTNYLLSKISKDKSGEFAQVAWGLIEDPKYMAEMLKLPGGYKTAAAIGTKLKQAITTGTAAQSARSAGEQ